MSKIIRIAFLDDYMGRAEQFGDWSGLGEDAEVVFFHHLIPAGELIDQLAEFDVITLTQDRTRLPRSVLEKLPRLKLVVVNSPRVYFPGLIDQDYLAERGILLCGTASPEAPFAITAAAVASTVENAWALIFATTKRVVVEDKSVRAGGWQTDFPIQLHGLTLGLAGVGNLGSRMVAPARAFGMEVIAWSENLTQERANELEVRRVSKEELLRESDVLGIFLVLSDRTHHLFGAPEFAMMKQTSFLINNSRGPIVDEAALIEALESGQLAGAGLDVYDHEPLPRDHQLTRLSNAVLLPHMGFVTEARFRGFYQAMAEDIVAFVKGTPIHVIS